MCVSTKNRTTPLIASVCCVRHTVSEPQTCARFASDVFGLQQVAGRSGELAFRSDDRYRTVSLSDQE
jgi:2,3-dihydroxy-p-cumate/2,3-dihydroxybenzoate 3,4-dioxygenase